MPKAEIVVKIDTSEAMLDWLQQTNPGMTVDYNGVRKDFFSSAGLAEARRLLAACKPVSRPPKPQGSPETWLIMNRLAKHFSDGHGRVYAVARLIVGPDGLVKGCPMSTSTGSAAADQDFCRPVTARARFVPGANDRGVLETTTYNFRVSLDF